MLRQFLTTNLSQEQFGENVALIYSLNNTQDILRVSASILVNNCIPEQYLQAIFQVASAQNDAELSRMLFVLFVDYSITHSYLPLQQFLTNKQLQFQLETDAYVYSCLSNNPFKQTLIQSKLELNQNLQILQNASQNLLIHFILSRDTVFNPFLLLKIINSPQTDLKTNFLIYFFQNGTQFQRDQILVHFFQRAFAGENIFEFLTVLTMNYLSRESRAEFVVMVAQLIYLGETVKEYIKWVLEINFDLYEEINEKSEEKEELQRIVPQFLIASLMTVDCNESNEFHRKYWNQHCFIPLEIQQRLQTAKEYINENCIDNEVLGLKL
ncbi:Hypothetical_protein [Hexamita inflata]|uniref:Hypothetical_protein n=1 Tax=Hexamita inflata TaxID=28002 RepID=A0AA86VRX2_9EUKA|nr:Hypothetical protein HINF_LOCUS62703 [Hexamita inflata]